MTKFQKGSSLVEILLVIVTVTTMVFLIANIPNAINLMNKSKHLSIAREIATKQIEDKRNINYANLVNDASPINDPRLISLPKGAGTITVEDCGLTICTNEEHIKQVTATITWQDNNKTQTTTLKTMIGEGGLNQ